MWDKGHPPRNMKIPPSCHPSIWRQIEGACQASFFGRTEWPSDLIHSGGLWSNCTHVGALRSLSHGEPWTEFPHESGCWASSAKPSTQPFLHFPFTKRYVPCMWLLNDTFLPGLMEGRMDNLILHGVPPDVGKGSIIRTYKRSGPWGPSSWLNSVATMESVALEMLLMLRKRKDKAVSVSTNVGVWLTPAPCIGLSPLFPHAQLSCGNAALVLLDLLCCSWLIVSEWSPHFWHQKVHVIPSG